MPRRTWPALSLLLASSLACGPIDDVELVAGEAGEPIRNGAETQGFAPVGLLLDDAAARSCTATLIGRDTVLTAAHCVKGSPASSLSFTLAKGPVFFTTDLHRASAKKVHASYDESAPGRVEEEGQPTLLTPHGGADLAVVKLIDRFGSVPRYALDGGSVAGGDVVRIVGYGQDTGGASGAKQVGKMRVRALADGPATAASGYGESLLALEPTDADQSACPGDSGGPALAEGTGGALTLAGVASFVVFPPGTVADDVCAAATGAYYTGVARFSSWIKAARTALSPPGSCVPRDDGRFATLAGGCKDRQAAKVWSKPAGARTRARALGYCDALAEGGRTDWRLPAKGELVVVAQHGAKKYLSGSDDAFYWTRTLAADGRGLTVRLGDGVTRAAAKSAERRVVCVRG